jgi:hypothetical protein
MYRFQIQRRKDSESTKQARAERTNRFISGPLLGLQLDPED